ncbi:MAG: hypothetical protein AAB425_05960, partial [Bdellovibrionota bacterium]
MWTLLIGLSASTWAFAGDSPLLGEAVGLDEPKSAQDAQAAPQVESRGYLLAEGVGKVTDRWMDDFPAAELGLNAKWKPSWTLLLDGQMDVTGKLAPKREPDSILVANQLFLRARVPEDWMAGVAFTLGKERSRRSSALILSPSDFLYARDGLPGQRGLNQGRWQAKWAWSSGVHGIDLAVLPWSADRDNGIPDTQTAQAQTWARASSGFGSWDFGIQGGRLSNAWKVGANVQTYLWDVEKLYAEWGYSADEPEPHHAVLIGTVYEGSEVVTARGEFLYQGAGMDSDEYDRLLMVRKLFPAIAATVAGSKEMNLFLRRFYAIGQVGFPEIRDRLNFFVTGIKSLEDRGLFLNFRLEWLIASAWAAGGTYGYLGGDTDSQYRFSP